MSFDTFETSTESASPVEIFLITAGADSYFYTSAEDDVLVGAQIYTAIEGLRRSKNVEGPEERENDFQIELPTSNPVAQIFTGEMPGIRIKLQVRKFHREDTPTPEVVQIFEGFIQSASFKDKLKKTILTARTKIASVGKQIPRRTFQASCNHVLYDSLTCQVDDTDVAFRASTLSVDSMVGSILTVSSGLMGTYADGYMAGGYVEIVGGSDFRMIRTHFGNVLTMHAPFSVTPTSINVYAGCSHVINVCSIKFGNVNRYGGFFMVPKKNVYQTGIF